MINNIREVKLYGKNSAAVIGLLLKEMGYRCILDYHDKPNLDYNKACIVIYPSQKYFHKLNRTPNSDRRIGYQECVRDLQRKLKKQILREKRFSMVKSFVRFLVG